MHNHHLAGPLHLLHEQEGPSEPDRAVLCLFVGLWAFSSFMFLHAPTFRDAHFWTRIIGLFWTMPSALAFHFILVFTGKTKLLRRPTYLMLYAPAIFFSAMTVVSNQIIRDPVARLSGYGFDWATTSPLYWISLFWTLGLAALAIGMCVRFYARTSDPEKKQQAKYISAGFSIPVVTAVATNIVFPALGLRIPTLTISSMTGLAVFVAYAIQRYQLFAVNPATAAENILSTMHDSLILIDPQGNILAANKATSDLLGYTTDELLGRRAADIFANKTTAGRTSEASIGRPDVKNHETAYLTKDGKSVPVLFSSSEIKDGRGKSAGLVIVAKNIAKRKEAEQALKFSEERFRAIADTAVDAMITIDSNSRILFWNGAAERQFGYPAKEATGKRSRSSCPNVTGTPMREAWRDSWPPARPTSSARPLNYRL